MSGADAQAIRDMHAAALEMERAGISAPRDPHDDRIAALEAQLLELTRMIEPRRGLRVVAGGKARKGRG